MAAKESIKLLNYKSINRLQTTAASLSTWAGIESFQLNTHTRHTRDPELIAAYQLEDIATWAEKLLTHVQASSPVQDAPQES